jgi:hypothetical protein
MTEGDLDVAGTLLANRDITVADVANRLRVSAGDTVCPPRVRRTHHLQEFHPNIVAGYSSFSGPIPAKKLAGVGAQGYEVRAGPLAFNL